MGRTKVAPLKSISIPKLELCAAVFLAKLIQYILEALNWNSILTHARSDSLDVLGWLQKLPSRWPTFIADRVSEIITRIPNALLRHVPSLDILADSWSREISPSEFPTHPLWWTGPIGLLLPAEKWPENNIKPNPEKETSKPSIYSDNGTKFQGADRELPKNFKMVTRSNLDANIVNNFAADGLVWKMMPPGRPHFGSLWEAGVKSAKHHLRRSVDDKKLTFEELTTLLFHIEACLNWPPINVESDSDPDDFVPLTRGHCLIAGPFYPCQNLRTLI